MDMLVNSVAENPLTMGIYKYNLVHYKYIGYCIC